MDIKTRTETVRRTNPGTSNEDRSGIAEV